MAATTIARATLTDNVTLWNAATVNSAIYDAIDSLIGAAITFGGLVHSEAHGQHNFTSSGTGELMIYVRNTSASGNYTGFRCANDVSNDVFTFASTHDSLATGYTGLYPQDAGYIKSTRAGGIAINAGHASGTVKIGASDTEVMRISSAVVAIRHGGATPDMGPGALTITGPASNFGQQVTLSRTGTAQWSLGYAYNTSTFAIGAGQATDSNFTAAAAALLISGTQVQIRDGSAATPSIGFADDTNVGLYRVGADAVGVACNGTLMCQIGNTITPQWNQVTIPNITASIAAGANLAIGCNTTNPAPAVLTLRDKDNVAWHLWVDNTGDLRISTTFANNTTGDTIGTVVGTQT